MKYVSHVKSSIKKGCDVQLSPRTVIVGPNGSGKTTVVQSIELATNGWVSDMEGREQVKQSKALSRLFADHSSMYAQAVVTDTESGTETSFDWSMKAGPRGGFKTPVHEPPFRLVFPVQDLITTLKGDASTVGAWLEKQVLDEMSTDDLLSALPPAVRDDAESFINRQRQSDFLALAKAAAQESKNLKTKATRSEKTVEAMVEGIAPPMTDGKLAELEARRAELSQQTGKAVSQQEYDALQKAVTRIEGEIAALQEKIPQIPSVPDKAMEALDKVNGAKHLIRAHVDMFGVDSCWICGNEDSDAIAKQVDTLTGIETELREFRELATLRRDAEVLLCSSSRRPGREEGVARRLAGLGRGGRSGSPQHPRPDCCGQGEPAKLGQRRGTAEGDRPDAGACRPPLPRRKGAQEGGPEAAEAAQGGFRGARQCLPAL